MSDISRAESKILMGMGSVWGTPRDLAASGVGYLSHARLTFTDSFNEYRPNDVGFDLFIRDTLKLQRSVGVTYTCDMQWNAPSWLQVLACVMGGTTSSPAEATETEGDYVHTITLTSNNKGKFMTLAFLIEDDEALEIPSVKWNTCTLTWTTNGVGTFTASGIGDRVVLNANAQNKANVINAGSYAGAFQAAPLGALNAGNHYFRLNDSDGDALGSGDDMEIQGCTLTVNRAMDPKYVLRAANSPFTVEPRQTTLTEATFQFTHWKIDSSIRDWYANFLAEKLAKGELHFDGDQIGDGENQSLMLQMPGMKPAPDAPGGYGVDDNSSHAEPNPSYTLLKLESAPTNMTGVTGPQFVATIPRSTSLFN